MKTKILSLVLLLSVAAHADCVINARSKTKVTIVDSHTIILSGGIGPDIMIKSWAFFNRFSEITVLKDSFCSYESDVLLVDGQVEDVNQVTKL